MRPKLLEIEGLQSFTDVQKIEFETLSETGLFGIFGPTGSGKSSILDAITFALYGKVKRAEGGTQGIINTSRDTARVAFTFELSRDGKRRTYRAERTYRRKKNSLNACEPKVTRLIEVTDAGEIPLCDKAMEMSYYVKDLLGLSNDDFTRAVVLPQNSFHEFLMLNNSDRRGMLERIFYLEEYGKQLLDKLGRKMSGLRSKLDVMTGELRGYADATDDALLEAEKTAEVAAVEMTRVEKALKQLNAKHSEAKEVWSLVQELREFGRREAEHTAGKVELDQKRILLDKAIKADSLTEKIRKNRELHKNIGQTKVQFEEAVTVFTGVFSSLVDTREKYEIAKREAAAEQPKLVGRRTRLVDAQGIKGEIEGLSGRITVLGADVTRLNEGIAQKRNLIKEETERFGLYSKDIERLMQEMEPLKTDPEYRQHLQEGVKLENEAVMLKGSVNDLETRQKGMRSSAEIIEQRLGSIKEEIEGCIKIQESLTAENRMQIASKPGDKNAVLKAVERIHAVDGTFQVLRLRKSELDQSLTRLEIQKADLVQLERKANSLKVTTSDASENFRQCRLAFEKAEKELNRNSAAVLAQNLKNGDPCPVCGSKEHPAPAINTGETELSVFEKTVEEAEKMAADAQAALQAAERENLVADEQVKIGRKQCEQAARELERKTGEYEEAKLKLPEKLRELELEQICQEIENAKSSYTDKLSAIEAWELKQEEHKESLSKLNESLSQKHLIENGIATELKMNSEGLDQVAKSIVGAKKSLNEAQEKYSAFLTQHHIDDVSEELKRIVQNDRHLKVLQDETEKNREVSGSTRIKLDKLNDELRQLNNDHIRNSAELNALNGQKQEREIKLKELAGDADIDDEIRSIDETIKNYIGQEEEFTQILTALEKQYNELTGRKSMLENQIHIYSESLEKDENSLRIALAEKGFADCEEVEKSEISKDDQTAMKDSISEYDRVLVNLQAQSSLLQKKLRDRSITEEEWVKIEREYVEMEAYKQECISNSEVARNVLVNLKKKHETWLELGRKYNEMSHRMGLFEQIQKILKAEHRKDNSFIDYIAEERLRYVAANASQTLGVMTKDMYGLELDAQAGFIIRDQANGGVHRMVTSLSGGETFLTSLSLALALSEQIQLKGQSPLEFFFLDEGFGTLDQNLLDAVIDSLERLSSKDRVIGLISHVPELKSRIARRLIVQPPSIHGEGTRISIEKA